MQPFLLESICEPISHRGSFGHNLNEGFEEYAPRQNAGNRTDSLCEWAIAISEKGQNKPLDEVHKALIPIFIGVAGHQGLARDV